MNIKLRNFLIGVVVVVLFVVIAGLVNEHFNGKCLETERKSTGTPGRFDVFGRDRYVEFCTKWEK